MDVPIFVTFKTELVDMGGRDNTEHQLEELHERYSNLGFPAPQDEIDAIVGSDEGERNSIESTLDLDICAILRFNPTDSDIDGEFKYTNITFRNETTIIVHEHCDDVRRKIKEAISEYYN